MFIQRSVGPAVVMTLCVLGLDVGSTSGQECGGNLIPPSGVITSPNYPNNYRNNLQCIWYINAQPGQIIKLEFTAFELETSPTCIFDYVKVYNGRSTSTSRMATLCNAEIPSQRTYFASSSSMVVYFRTDSSLVKGGFRATYTNGRCGGVLTAPTGVISSPNYPKSYENNLQCYWYINVQPGQKVRLEFTHIDLETCCDCVKLYNRNSTSASYRIANSCSGTLSTQRTYDASFNSMVVEFKTDFAVRWNTGFSATYTIYD